MREAEKLPAIGRPFQIREAVRITCDGRTVDGIVTIASANGRSLVIAFDAMLAGHVGMMPVFQYDDGAFHSILNGAPVEITLKETRH